MNRRPCPCGSTPKFVRRFVSGIFIMRLQCQCGNHGATLMFKRRDQASKMKYAAVDGWNLAG